MRGFMGQATHCAGTAAGEAAHNLFFSKIVQKERIGMPKGAVDT